jgi:hypothetical protein
MTKWNKTIFTCKRRCWACKSCSSCSLRCIKRSNAAAFFFLVVSSSKYAILHELNCDYGSYTRLCSVELPRTDWGRCSEAGLLYVHVTMTPGKRLGYPYSALSVSSSSLLRVIIGAIGHFSPHEDHTKETRSCPIVLGRQHDYLKASQCRRVPIVL